MVSSHFLPGSLVFGRGTSLTSIVKVGTAMNVALEDSRQHVVGHGCTGLRLSHVGVEIGSFVKAMPRHSQ